MLPKQYRDRPGDVLLAMAYAQSLALPVAQVFVGLHVIDGKPSMSSELMNALILRAGHRTRVVNSPPGPWVDAWASFTITRSDDPENPYTDTFSIRDALQAKLLTLQPDGSIRSRTKNGEPTPWENYPRAMLRARAISAAARAVAPDVLAGVSYTPDEIETNPSRLPYVDADPEPEVVEQTPEAGGARVPGNAGPSVDVDLPADPEGDHTREVDSGPQNGSEGVEMSDPQADGVPWLDDWHNRLNEATGRFDYDTVRALGHEAAENNRDDLVEIARARYGEIQRKSDDIARDGS
jgi:hypothetical protein